MGEREHWYDIGTMNDVYNKLHSQTNAVKGVKSIERYNMHSPISFVYLLPLLELTPKPLMKVGRRKILVPGRTFMLSSLITLAERTTLIFTFPLWRNFPLMDASPDHSIKVGLR